MRRKGHLCLIGGTNVSVPEVSINVTEISKSSKEKYSPQSRIRAADEELTTMREVTDAAFFLMRSLPMEQLEIQELLDLYDMFVSGEDVLDLYVAEFAQLSQMRLSPLEMKQLSKLRKMHFHLSDIIPEASEKISEVIRALQTSSSKGKKIAALNAVSLEKGHLSIVPASSQAKSSTKVKAKKAKIKKQSPPGLQLKVTLKGSRPLVWRRIHVPGDCSLPELHETIQNSMGWENSHLHCFKINGRTFSENSESSETEATRYNLSDFSLKPSDKFEYCYDFGDNWIHTVEMEEWLDNPIDYFECVTGKNACPPEDSGGVRAYAEKLAILKNPSHPEHAEIKEWFGEDFDAHHFA